MRANPKLLSGTNQLWIKFFQLAVFATMYVRDHNRPEFHKALGIEPESYGMEVFRITSEICKQVFPLLLDVEHPGFLAGLRKLQALAVRIDAAQKAGGLFGKLRSGALQVRVGLTMLGLYMLPAKGNSIPEKARLAPAW
jgi:magnesium-protoporphyrin IX monomethyl ester (oxidative) cyclase